MINNTKVFAIALLAVLGCQLCAGDVPHLFYNPDGTVRLQLSKVLPAKMRLCAVGKKFTFCSPWIVPTTDTVDVDLKIPANTPDGDYGVFYEDEKKRVDLKNHFQVEK